MDWQTELNGKIKRKNQLLFSKDSILLQPLRAQLDAADRKTVIFWALLLAEETVRALEEKYPTEESPRAALEACKLWAAGDCKMPQAKKEILACHGLAKRLESPADIARCHAVGQACSTVHTKGHAMGFPIYDLTALVRSLPETEWEFALPARVREYEQRLRTAEKELPQGRWAPFLRK